VAEAVVDRLEVVEIEEQDARCPCTPVVVWIISLRRWNR
jgi:hypothetical protein